MDKANTFKRVRRILGVVVAVLVVLYAALVIYRIPAVIEQEKTEETITFIKSQKLTLKDVMGENLPPTPDPSLVDATVEGVDANNNLIRDDVELAIFELYPDDPVIRSAMLQYAMGLQLKQTQVFNSETWVAAVEESGRGSLCLSFTGPPVDLEMTQEEANRAFAVSDARIDAVESFVYNTDLRTERKEEVIQFIYGHGGSDKPERCDLDPETFIEGDAS